MVYTHRSLQPELAMFRNPRALTFPPLSQLLPLESRRSFDILPKGSPVNRPVHRRNDSVNNPRSPRKLTARWKLRPWRSNKLPPLHHVTPPPPSPRMSMGAGASSRDKRRRFLRTVSFGLKGVYGVRLVPSLIPCHTPLIFGDAYQPFFVFVCFTSFFILLLLLFCHTFCTILFLFLFLPGPFASAARLIKRSQTTTYALLCAVVVFSLMQSCLGNTIPVNANPA